MVNNEFRRVKMVSTRAQLQGWHTLPSRQRRVREQDGGRKAVMLVYHNGILVPGAENPSCRSPGQRSG